MFHFVYVTTNIINGKQYIGDHSSDRLNDSYIGSGNLILKAKKKYGLSNFRRDILEKFDTKEEAFFAQEKYIKEYNTLSPNGYNISPSGGMEISGFHSDYTKEIIRNKRKNQKSKSGWTHSPSTIDKIKKSVSEANKGRISPNKGNSYSTEIRAKISNSMSGSRNHNHISNITEERKLILKENLKRDQSGKNNGMYGKNHSEESNQRNRKSHLKENLSASTIDKMKNSAKNKPRINCKYCGKTITYSMHTRWHGEKCKNK